jgi:hypothetical protein
VLSSNEDPEKILINNDLNFLVADYFCFAANEGQTFQLLPVFRSYLFVGSDPNHIAPVCFPVALPSAIRPSRAKSDPELLHLTLVIRDSYKNCGSISGFNSRRLQLINPLCCHMLGHMHLCI